MAANIFGTVSSAEPSGLNASFGGGMLVLKMGSTIIPKHHRENYHFGVVGPFVKGPNGIFFVTANHVITQIPMPWSEDIKPPILQLYHKEGVTYGSRTCGAVSCGGKDKSPAALIEITQEQFEKTEYFMRKEGFSFEGISAINFPTYDNRDSSNRTSVFVFGSELRTATAKIVVDNMNGIIVLTTDKYDFTKKVEGGAAIFIVDQFNILHCVGIFVCHSTIDTRTIVVRPIQKILHKLGKEIGQQLEIASFDKDLQENCVRREEFRRELSYVRDTFEQTHQQRDADLNPKLHVINAQIELKQKGIEECRVKSEAGIKLTQKNIEECRVKSEEGMKVTQKKIDECIVKSEEGMKVTQKQIEECRVKSEEGTKVTQKKIDECIKKSEAGMKVTQKKIDECILKSEAATRQSEERVDEIVSLVESLRVVNEIQIEAQTIQLNEHNGHFPNQEVLDL